MNKYKPNTIYETSSGRKTSPTPKYNSGSDRKINNSYQKFYKWLFDNAIIETIKRGDKYNCRRFEKMNLKNLSQTDKDSLEIYLFG
jgi:hypothetical protein